MTKIQAAIVRAIVMAQIASDAGKGIYDIHLPGGDFPGKTGYRSKEFYEIRALRMIDSSPRCGINYWVELALDQNGYSSFIVYFDIKVGEKRHQISFHNPAQHCFGLWDFENRGRKTRWTRDLGGSRRACEELAKYLVE